MNLDWTLLGFRVAAALILYSFLGVALYLIWRDLQAAAVQSVETALELPCLCLLEAGEGDGWPAGHRFPLKPVTSLGRDLENDIVIADPAVSVRHARLTCTNGAWWLEDLDSKNGTTLNGLPLAKPVTLADGDVIGVGQARLRFETKPQ